MNREFKSYDKYRSDYVTFQQNPKYTVPAWLQDVRTNAKSAFDQLGFPTKIRGNEKWKYTNVRPLAGSIFEYPFNGHTEELGKSDLEVHIAGDEKWNVLVFIDGNYSPTLSSYPNNLDNIQIENLRSALQKGGSPIENHLGRHANFKTDGFTAINTAFLDNGAYVCVPNDTAISTPVHLLFVSTQREIPTASHPRSLITVGQNSNLTILESYLGLTNHVYFTNSVTEIVAEAGASVEHYRYVMESPNAFHIGTTRVKLGQDSILNSISIAKGAKLARNDTQVLLNGPGASCALSGLYVTSGKQHIDNHINIDHAMPHTNSQQYFKGILADESRAVFSGRVLIERDAQKSNASQADKNLMLSDGARINTKPSMEIFADDVKAVHGATAGTVASDALFYMNSRGLDLKTAMSLLVYGFASEIIDTIRLKPFREHVDKILHDTMSNFKLAPSDKTV